MTPDQVYSAIHEAFLDWGESLANPRYCRDGNFVSWTRFDGGRLKDPLSTQQISSIVRHGQFSFQVVDDGSIFQLLYQFDKNNDLLLARLAFYLLKTRGSYEDGTIELVTSSWIRFDFDKNAAKGVLHHDCHLHLHGFPNSRIVVDGVPGPRQFVEFVMAACYPITYELHRLDQNGDIANPQLIGKVNDCFVPGPAREAARSLLHISLPK